MDVSPNMPHPFTIGTHQRQLPMNMGDPTTVDTLINQDASIFKIVAVDRISSMQQNSYDTPAASMPLMGGMHVKKVGRSSGFTEGVVLGEMVGAHRVNYQAPEHAFSGPVYFDRMFAVVGKADRFSEPGDSGSLVVHEAPDGIDYAVGIIVAGYTDNRAPGNIVSLIMPIEPILVSFNVTLVAGHNV
ncbi:hypothetical protein CEY09_14395 [Achromobacter marplatensis]|nr:hypothetical protein CEY09_14395 [Achromobacter marplatensis]